MFQGSSKEARQTVASGTWDSHRILIDCDGYSCVLVANSGLIDSKRPTPPARIVRRGSGGQQRRQNCRHTGTVESRSIFDGASGSSAKAIILMNLIPLS